MNNTDFDFVRQMYIRHGMLVDKKFLEGLSKREDEELLLINRLLDVVMEEYYAPIKKILLGKRMECPACGQVLAMPEKETT